MFVLPPVAVLQPPKPVEGPTKRQGNLAEKNGFSMGVVKKSENLNCTGPSNNEAAGWGGGARQRTHIWWGRGVFVCGSFAWSLYPSPGSRKPVLWQFAEAENRTSKGGGLLTTEHGNKKRTDSQTRRKKKTLKTNTPALTYATLSTFSALHQIGNKPLFFTVVQRWDFSRSFFSYAVLVLRCLLQVKHPLSLTWPRWRRKRSCKRAPSAWLKQMVHEGEKKKKNYIKQAWLIPPVNADTV